MPGREDKTVLICCDCERRLGVRQVLCIGRITQDPTQPCYACGRPAGSIEASSIVWRSSLGSQPLPGDAPRSMPENDRPRRIKMRVGYKGYRILRAKSKA